MQEILLKIRCFERGLSKSLKKFNLFFLWNLFPFNAQSYQKQKGPGTSEQLLFRLWNKFRKIPLIVMYYLTTIVDVKQFLCYSKNYICRVVQDNLWNHKLFLFCLSFWIVRKGKNCKNLNIAKTKRAFSMK